MRPARHDRGQVLIITAFAMIVLVAIAAIVVDLGFSWMLHRKEQNAVDPGSLAAAKWIRDPAPAGKTQMQAMEDEACFYAQENGFFQGDANCFTALNVTGDLDVNYPPATAMAGNFQGRLGYVEVIIHDTHPSFFGQVFGRPVADVTTAAVAALTDGQATTSSLVALGRDCNGDDEGDSSVTGGGTVNIFPASGVTQAGGYVNVNASCGSNDGNNDDICANGSGASALSISGVLSAPFVSVVGGCAFNGSGTPQPECTGVPPCLDEGAIPLGDPLAGLPEPWPLLNLPAPACPKPTDINSVSDGNPCELSKATCPKVGSAWICTMDPGVYYAGWDIKSGTKTEPLRVVFKPGMYVFAGGGITPGPNTTLETATGLDGTGNVIDARITIFSTDGPNCPAMARQCEGSIKLTSTGALRLKATDATTCQQSVPEICAWKGILIWIDGSVNGTPGDIEIEGQAELVMSGTIYAPESNVKITGGTNGSGCTVVPGQDLNCLAIQIISESWAISGGAVVDMPYDPSQLYVLEQQGLVH